MSWTDTCDLRHFVRDVVCSPAALHHKTLLRHQHQNCLHTVVHSVHVSRSWRPIRKPVAGDFVSRLVRRKGVAGIRPKRSAAFCFPYRQYEYAPANSDPAFVKHGYRNWKNATDSNKGFAKHASSSFHLNSVTRLLEQQRIKKHGTNNRQAVVA